MLFYSFAHRVLLAFGLFVICVLVLLATKFGILGEGAQAALARVWDPASNFYILNQTILDRAAAIIGTVGSAVLAALSVHKWWHYAERNLPARIEEFNARWKAADEGARERLIPLLAHHHMVALPIKREPGLLGKWVRWIYDPANWAAASSHKEVMGCEAAVSILTTSRARAQVGLRTAHLVYGASLSGLRRGEEALAEFERAARLDKRDLDALELAGRQAAALNRLDVAQRHLRELAEAAARKGDVQRRTRAMRFQAEILKSGLPAEQVQARDTLRAAMAILTEPNSLDGNARSLELCLAYGQLADVQTVRNTLSSARSALNQAYARLNKIDQGPHVQIRGWLGDVDRRLAQAEKDRDRDNERDEDKPGD